MSDLVFEESLEKLHIQGTCSCEVVELTPPGIVPSSLIRKDQDWGVRLRWTTHGELAPILDAMWHIQILLDPLGVANYELPEQYRLVRVAFDQHTLHEYDITAKIPKGIVPLGTYKLVVVMTLKGKTTGVPAPVAGFAEGPILNFFDPGPPPAN